MSDLRLPMDNEEYRASVQELAEVVFNGFVYQGDRIEAVIDTLVALRANPELAARVLA